MEIQKPASGSCIKPSGLRLLGGLVYVSFHKATELVLLLLVVIGRECYCTTRNK